jgi:DNA-binding LytR/AlgR family response regulator
MKSYSKYIGLGEQLSPELQKLTPCFKRELHSKKCKSVGEILYCEAKGSYSRVHLSNDENFMLSFNLKELSDFLPEKDFARCHRSFLVNLNHIKNVDGEPCKVILSDGRILDISVRKKKLILSYLQVN